MVIVRPTADLAKRMKMKLDPAVERSTNRLGDWFACDFVLERRQYILCVSENGLLPVVLPAAPYKYFSDRLWQILPEILRFIGVSPENIEKEMEETVFTMYAKTNNRSILGFINQYRQEIQAMPLVDSLHGRAFNHDPMEMSLRLSETLFLKLPESFPKEAVLRVFGRIPMVKAGRPHLTLVPRPQEEL